MYMSSDNNVMKSVFLSLIAMAFSMLQMFSQETDYPMIGAQVFIEPGQTESDIDDCFKTLHSAGMEVARIRIFGSHIIGEDGSLHFELYDHAFDCAAGYGIKLFATLFPPTDELNDIGGFKFPGSIAHLHEIEEYIRIVVSHFADKPALYAWVLQNEPGTGSPGVRKTDLSDYVRQGFEKEYGSYHRSPGYLNADFSDVNFQRYYTSWYLRWLALQVRKYDSLHFTHINPHALFETLPEYDFSAYTDFLTSLGVSIHASWHLGYFSRNRYSLGVSAMSDIIRNAAGVNPFWITEMQGGGVIASGNVPLTPTPSEIRQWLWTGIGAGAEGAIFWTLNPRASVNEGGEWAMIDYLGRPTGRLEAASEVITVVESQKDFFDGAEVVESGICILYNVESLIAASRNFKGESAYEGRKASSVMKSVVAAYKSISSIGVMPDISDMENFSWDSRRYPVAVIPNMIVLPERYSDKIEAYVRDGGRLIVTGLTGFYNEDMLCMYRVGFPLEECFGGTVSEFVVMDDLFGIGYSGSHVLTGHLWKGILSNISGDILFNDYEGRTTGTVHSFGKGTVVWVPSLVDLGDWVSGDCKLAAFYRKYCLVPELHYPVFYRNNCNDTFMRLLRKGDTVMAVLVNNNSKTVRIKFSERLVNVCRVVGDGRLSETSASVPANDVIVLKFKLT